MTDSLVIDGIGGNCPVQAEGTVDGVPFYFRGRGEHWQMNIGGDDLILCPDWCWREAYGDHQYAAGWMSEDEALLFIEQAVARWRDEVPTMTEHNLAGLRKMIAVSQK